MNHDDLAILFGSLSFLFLVVNFFTMQAITGFLKIRGIKISYALLHIYIFNYARQYKEITKRETGSIGILYYPFIWSFIFFVIFLLAGIYIVSDNWTYLT